RRPSGFQRLRILTRQDPREHSGKPRAGARAVMLTLCRMRQTAFRGGCPPSAPIRFDTTSRWRFLMAADPSRQTAIHGPGVSPRQPKFDPAGRTGKGSMSPGGRRSRIRVTVLAALALAGAAPSAHAQTITQAQSIYVTDGEIFALARSGNTIYLGGSFFHVGLETGGGVPVN